LKLRELEKRLKHEPENLGLRVTVAGLMREGGRTVEAVELYRSVALAYRDQGRTQQAIAVCRSILEIAPDDQGCQALLSSLDDRPSPDPKRRSSLEETPLPKPVPYHIADPTSSAQRVRVSEPLATPALPAAEGADTRPGNEPRRSTAGLAQAARTISGLFEKREDSIEIDVSAELDTRKVAKIDTDQLAKIAKPPPTVPVPLVDQNEIVTTDREDTITPLPGDPRDSDDELTDPRDLLPRKHK